MRFSHSPVFRPTFAEISLSRLEANARWLHSLTPEFFCPMIKSNAYGHGDVEVARRLSSIGIKTFGLALIEEALRLRSNGLEKERLLVFGSFDAQGAGPILQHKITPVLSLWSEVEHLKNLLSSGANFPVHLKFNSGMARLGFDPSEASELKRKLEVDGKLKLTGVCSHLSHGEDAGENQGRSTRQFEILNSLKDLFGQKVDYHLLNSAGGLSLWAHDRMSEFHCGFRPGISLYGLPPEIHFHTPQAKEKWRKLPLQAALKLRSGVIHYHSLKAGETVSYGGQWTAARPSIVGVIPIGYADGYTRHFSNRGQMLYRGQRVPVVGTVCMDYTMVDLTDVLNNRFGEYAEEVVLIGEQGQNCLGADEVAHWAGTISYEILTCVGRRVPRKYLD